tara:strand:+ start:160 stop:1581 length:1422 start_codon:yes stop_codon:yes gene_type:complete
MSVYWNDLALLNDVDIEFKDIKDVYESNNSITLSNNNANEFIESIMYFIDDYLNQNIQIYKEYNFQKILFETMCNIIEQAYGDILNNLDINLYDIVNKSIELYLYTTNRHRSYLENIIVRKPDVKKIKKRLKYIEKTKEQPDQRTKEWYLFRYNGLTASSIWKAVDTTASRNNLIYEKCKPLKIDSGKEEFVNINTPFHNGHKYEPLSILIYEKIHNTKVGEFGCIKHDNLSFLKASPDGINIDPKNKLYGRMLEIKNPTTRKISGVPKKEYWVQMQIQMEVWDLNECDFLETSFKEYENEEEFLKDTNGVDDVYIKSSKNERKGVILMFNDGKKPIYEYAPVDINSKDFEAWCEKKMTEYEGITWIKNIYWRLETYSCVLVPRNKKWFEYAAPLLQDTWDTILKERVEGYDHRKPKKKTSKKKLSPKSIEKLNTKVTKLFPNKVEIKNSSTPIIKIRTESFDKNKKNTNLES